MDDVPADENALDSISKREGTHEIEVESFKLATSMRD
jgi:hypothetical protein